LPREGFQLPIPDISKEEECMQISLKEWLAQNGYSSAEAALLEYGELDDLYPALCSEDCQVEPDGHCPHGSPSLHLAFGII
jgi:hypothetical protein